MPVPAMPSESYKGRFRILAGFLLGPATPALIMYLTQVGSVANWEAIWAGKLILVVGYSAALVFGVPAYFLLKKRGALGLASVLLAGTLTGLLTYLMLFGPAIVSGMLTQRDPTPLVLANTLGYSILGLTSGCIAGGVFWLVALWRKRPSV